MVPRMRHRVCLETLRRELQLVDGPTPFSSPSLAVKDLRFKPDDHCDFTITDPQSVSVGNKIPGFRTSAGMHKAQCTESVVIFNVSGFSDCAQI